MKNPSEGKTPEGYPWRRARLCDIFPGLTSRGWRWFLYSKTGDYLRNFATRREMLWFSANRGLENVGVVNATQFEREGRR